MPGAAQLIGAPGIEQQSIHMGRVLLELLEIVGFTHPQRFPPLLPGVALFQVLAAFV